MANNIPQEWIESGEYLDNAKCLSEILSTMTMIDGEQLNNPTLQTGLYLINQIISDSLQYANDENKPRLDKTKSFVEISNQTV